MGKSIRNMLAALGALALMSGAAAAQKVTIAVGGAGCLCYLPTMLAEQLGEYRKAGIEVELIDFKGGSQSLTAVIGGSADVVSGYFDHCVNLAAKNQALEAFVVYDRYPGLALVVGPKQTGKMDPKGAQAVLDVFSQSSPEVKNAKIDLSKTYTNKFVEAAGGTTGAK